MSRNQRFTCTINESIKTFIAVSQLVDRKVGVHSEILNVVLKKYLVYLNNPYPIDFKIALEDLDNYIMEVHEFKNANREYKCFKHLSAINEAVYIFYWHAYPDPRNFAGSTIESVKYFTNGILQESDNKDVMQTKWVNELLAFLNDFSKYIKDISVAQSGLPKAESSKTACLTTVVQNLSTLKLGPVFKKEGKKWFVENHHHNNGLMIDDTAVNHSVYMLNCSNTTLRVKGKIGAITMDKCKKSSILFDDLISSFTFNHCDSVQMQVFGKVPTVFIHKTDCCQIYLSQHALNLEVISSKSSEMNLMVPNATGDYQEYPIGDQFKSVFIKGKGVVTTVVDSKF